MSRIGVLAEEDAVGRLVRQVAVEEVRSVLRRLLEVEDVTEAERLDNPVEKAVHVERSDLLGVREDRFGEEARLHERLEGDRVGVRLVEEEVAADDDGDAALGLVAEAGGREALRLAGEERRKRRCSCAWRIVVMRASVPSFRRNPMVQPT